MKKAKKIITITIVLLTFCVSAFATGNVQDNTAPSSRTGTGTYSCRTIAPLHIYEIPDNIISGLILVKDATGNITYDLSAYDSRTLFEIHGQPGEIFYTSINMDINPSNGNAGNELRHVILNMTWEQSAHGFAWLPLDVSQGFTLISTGLYNFKATYNSITIEPGALPGYYEFEQTVTVSYDPFGGGGGGGGGGGS